MTWQAFLTIDPTTPDPEGGAGATIHHHDMKHWALKEESVQEVAKTIENLTYLECAIDAAITIASAMRRKMSVCLTGHCGGDGEFIRVEVNPSRK
jgi:hypothetical protein